MESEAQASLNRLEVTHPELFPRPPSQTADAPAPAGEAGDMTSESPVAEQPVEEPDAIAEQVIPDVVAEPGDTPEAPEAGAAGNDMAVEVTEAEPAGADTDTQQ